MKLIDKERSMLCSVILEYELWEEAVNIVCYLVNGFPSLLLIEKTPHEVWFGKNPSLTHLKIFGYETCICFLRRTGKNWITRHSSVFSLAT